MNIQLASRSKDLSYASAVASGTTVLTRRYLGLLTLASTKQVPHSFLYKFILFNLTPLSPSPCPVTARAQPGRGTVTRPAAQSPQTKIATTKQRVPESFSLGHLETDEVRERSLPPISLISHLFLFHRCSVTLHLQQDPKSRDFTPVTHRKSMKFGHGSLTLLPSLLQNTGRI